MLVYVKIAQDGSITVAVIWFKIPGFAWTGIDTAEMVIETMKNKKNEEKG